MQEIAQLSTQEKHLVTTGHSCPLKRVSVILDDDFKQFQTSFEIGISSDLIIKCLPLQHKPINNWLHLCKLYANYTHSPPHMLKLLTLTGAADVRHNLWPMGNHLLDHQKRSTQL